MTEVIHDAAVWVYDYIRTAQAMNPSQARSQPSDDGGGAFSSDSRSFSEFENWSSQWLSIGKTIDFFTRDIIFIFIHHIDMSVCPSVRYVPVLYENGLSIVL